jgi:hypothetical protein
MSIAASVLYYQNRQVHIIAGLSSGPRTNVPVRCFETARAVLEIQPTSDSYDLCLVSSMQSTRVEDARTSLKRLM